MASLNEVVSITISANTRTPTQLGFGTPLFLASVLNGLSSDVVTIAELSDFDDESITSDHAIYKMVSQAFSQNPRPPIVKIANVGSEPDHTQTITIPTSTSGDVISATVLAPDGTETTVTTTLTGGEDETDAASDIATAIDALTGCDAVAALGVVTVTPATPGNMVFLYDATRNGAQIEIKDTTADSDYDDALTALQLSDDDWYYVAIDINSEANVDKVAAWTEARVKRFVWQTQNTEEKEGTGTFGAGLKASGYKRTIGIFTDYAHEFHNCAWIGLMAPKVPGMATWAFKALAGCTAPSLTPTQEAALEADNIHYLTTINGLKVTFGPGQNGGVSAEGEYFDLGIGTDELTARIQEAIFGKIISEDKLAYDDPEIETIKNIVESIMRQRATPVRKFLIDSTIQVSAPAAADVDTADRANRLLPDVRFGAQFAGAIQKTVLEGTLTV